MNFGAFTNLGNKYFSRDSTDALISVTLQQRDRSKSFSKYEEEGYLIKDSTEDLRCLLCKGEKE